MAEFLFLSFLCSDRSAQKVESGGKRVHSELTPFPIGWLTQPGATGPPESQG